jgi:hypothetical protein
MKKTLFILLMLFTVTATFSQSRDGLWLVTESNEGYLYQYQKNDLDSGETVYTNGVDLTPLLAYIMQGNTGYTSRDTNLANYRYPNTIYATVIYDGSGVDSLSLLEFQGKGLNSSWNIVDTMRTKGATPIYTPFVFWSGIPFYTEGRFKIVVADLTVSSYDGILYIEFFVPKRRNK